MRAKGRITRRARIRSGHSHVAKRHSRSRSAWRPGSGTETTRDRRWGAGGGRYCTPGSFRREESGDQKVKGDLEAFGRGREPRATLGELLLSLRKGTRTERRARGGRASGAPRLLGYPLGFPLTFVKGRQGLELRPSSPADPRASRASGTLALEDAYLIIISIISIISIIIRLATSVYFCLGL